MTKSLYLYDNETLKWEHGGKRYCLHIQHDDSPEDPREWNSGLTVMACFHNHYQLGDDVGEKDAEEYWRRLVMDCVPAEEVTAAARAGKLGGVRLAPNEDEPERTDIYETCCWRTVIGTSEPEEVLEYEAVPEDMITYYLLDELTIDHCMTLMEPYAEWLPLWLYDHSGITMSCGERTYPYNDEWDSGQVGWILVLRDTLMKNFPLTEETWRRKAVEIMKDDVKVYDQYLTDEVCGYTLYETEDPGDEPDWEETDSCWGFFGSDILESGVVDNVGHGLAEALESDAYECGEATLHRTSWYTF